MSRYYKESLGINLKTKKNNNQIEIRLGSGNIGSLCGNGTEVAEKLKKRKVGIHGLQEAKEYCGLQ